MKNPALSLFSARTQRMKPLSMSCSSLSLRAGVASGAEIYVQKQLGHASSERAHRYLRRRDRFRTNLTKAAGL